jgi:hypothetical protein
MVGFLERAAAGVAGVDHRPVQGVQLVAERAEPFDPGAGG